MQNYILAILIIIILLIIFKQVSNFTPSDPTKYPSFFNIGKTISSGTSVVASSDNTLSSYAINTKLHTDPAYSTYWGFMKVLQAGGGGAVSYLSFAADSAATTALSEDAPVLTSTNFQGADYLVPSIIFMKKSATYDASATELMEDKFTTYW